MANNETNKILYQDHIEFVKLKNPIRTTCLFCVRKDILCEFLQISNDFFGRHHEDPICAECFKIATNFKEGKINAGEFFEFRRRQLQRGISDRINKNKKVMNEIENKKPSLGEKFFNLFKKKSNSKLNEEPDFEDIS